MHQKVQKPYFCDVTKVGNFDKKCLTLSEKTQKSPFNHFRFGKSKFEGERVKYLEKGDQKINFKNPFVALTNSKIKIFSKFKKQTIICRTTFFKTTFQCIRK
jgi:hypothetical protein